MTIEAATSSTKGGQRGSQRQSNMADRRQRISEAFPGQDDNSQVLKKTFDEWMKIVADNKINSSNSWTLALIDYFHDLTLLRDGDSINFQKASCTLDGCVKIYTSRVDSVDVETKKLLNGLQNYGNQADDGELDGDGPEVGIVKQKKNHRHTNTLEKDISNLDLKKLDIEFTVDPLFRKTSADFDEGGARGLLLNHLSISSNGQIIFDAGDMSVDALNGNDLVVEPCSIDYDKLKDNFKSRLARLWETEICWALQNFEFSNQDNQMGADIDFTKEAAPTDFYDFSPAIEDQESMGGDDFDDFGFVGDPEPFMPHESEGFLEEQAQYLPAVGPQEGVFSFFDTSMIRNWAGPEHWRSRPLASSRADKQKPKRKPQKEVEIINFLDPNPVDIKQLFASGSSINLAKNEKVKSKHLLPEDLHVSWKDIAKLFTNPEYKLEFRNKRSQRRPLTSFRQSGPDEGGQDDLFWAQNEMVNTDEPCNQIFDEDTPGGFDFDPFEDDEPGFANDGETPDVPPGDVSIFLDYGDQLVDQPKKVLAAPLRYAKTAKRVDVKRLKENIWKEMLDLTDESKDLPSEATFENPKKFTDLVLGLDNFYPEQKRQDISVAFCFICVLHLANEQNLSIQGSEQLKELIISQNK